MREKAFHWAWLVAVLAHLSLPDALQWSWLVPDLLLLGGAAGVLWASSPRVRRAAWALCVLGIALPLVLLDDQLTQSVFMLFVAVSGALCRDIDGQLQVVRRLTIVLYGSAFFHKLNHDFLFDAEASCAAGGVDLLADNWGFARPTWLRAFWAPAFLLAEGFVCVALMFRPRMALLVAVLMHIPLTIVFAPSFAWVMAAGWSAFLSEREWRVALALVRGRWKFIVAFGALLGGVSTAFYFRTHWVFYPAWQLKELLLWMLAVALYLFAWTDRAQRGTEAPAESTRSWPAYVLPALMMLNALTPYFGLQFHHAGAMLSNLRIDDGCWNHLFMPESLRMHDPYVYVDDAALTDDDPLAQRFEEMLEERVWTWPELVDKVESYCEHDDGPMRLTLRDERGTRRIDDGCRIAAQVGVEAGPSRFQTNLLRQCPQRCIH